MELFSKIIGNEENASYYRELRDKAVRDFQAAYFNSETNVVSTGSQAAYAFALHYRLVPEDARAKVFDNLLKEIERWEYRPSCGEVAWPFLIRTLSEFGRSDILWKMLQREDAPGYVHMLTKWGMKTLSETWDGPGSSMNHFMFGAIQEWFSSDVLGIRQSDESVGFKDIVLHPCPMIGKIDKAKGFYRSTHGRIDSDWEIDSSTGRFEWRVAIPTGTKGRLEIPVADETSEVKVRRLIGNSSSQLELDALYEESIGDNPNRKIVTVGSGIYVVESQLSK